MTPSYMTGLDVGTTSVRAVETVRSRGRTLLTAFAARELPAAAMDGGVVNDAGAVTAAIRQVWSEGKLRNRQVVLGVTSRQAVVRDVTIPRLPRRELMQALPFQARDVVPFAVDTAVLDFVALDTTTEGLVHGLLIAAPREPIIDLVRAVERASLHVRRVDLGSFAVLRAAWQPVSGAHAVVDIGVQSTTIVVHVEGKPRMVRTVPRGGDDITRALESRLQISKQAAEDRKRMVGVIDELDPGAAEVIREAVRPLVSELRTSLGYLGADEHAVPAERVHLCGGGALLPGLTDLLTDELGLPTTLADPLLRLQGHRRADSFADLKGQRSKAALSLGLTLGAAA